MRVLIKLRFINYIITVKWYNIIYKGYTVIILLLVLTEWIVYERDGTISSPNEWQSKARVGMLQWIGEWGDYIV